MAVAASSRQIASPAVRSLIERRLAQLGAIVLALLGVTLLVALATYNARDPSMDTATARRALNLVGPPGAVVSDLLLQGFGVAGVLPGLAMLAWAWRIGSGRGGLALTLRLAALLAALPVLGAVLAGVPAPHGLALTWPAGAGLGGAAGLLVADNALAAGRELLGPFGGVAVWGLGAILAMALVLLALGLTAGEWRAAGRAARYSAGQGGSAAGVFMRIGHRVGRFGFGLIRRLNGSRADAPASAPLPEAEPTLRRAARVATAAPEAKVEERPAPPQPSKPKVSTPARRPVPVQQESLRLEGTWQFPPLSLLAAAPARSSIGAPTEEALQANARLLESVLADYGVQGQIVEIRPGPVVTLYELEPAAGIRSARVIGLADDVARSLSVTAVRIATVPGRNVIGIEVPNAKRETVFLSELLASEEWAKQQGQGRLASPWARTSAARRSSPISRACRICWSPAPPARASRSASTR